jgi:hypothetical protein
MAITSKIDIAFDSAEFLALKTAFDKYETSKPDPISAA